MSIAGFGKPSLGLVRIDLIVGPHKRVIRWAASSTGGTYRCSDLELVDQDEKEENRGECRVAMSGPTCMNPDCPPCQTPETVPSFDPPQQKLCGGSGQLVMPLWAGVGEFKRCPGCSHPDCPNRQDQKGGEGWPEIRAIAIAICREVSGLSPEVREDVDDVVRALAPYVPAFPKTLLERLAGELEERGEGWAEKMPETRYRLGVSAGYKEAAQRLREEAEGLGEGRPLDPKSYYDHIVYRLTCLLNGRKRPTLEQIRDEFQALRDGTGPTLEDIVAEGRCEECGTLAGLWHKHGCSATLPPESQEGER